MTMTVSSYDAWVLSRILVDLPINGELAGVSDRWRALAKRLLAYPPTMRRGVLDGFAAAQPDPMALVQAILDARPTGPASERPVDVGERAPRWRMSAGWTWTGAGRGRAGCPAGR
jgi:hypothetical protein